MRTALRHGGTTSGSSNQKGDTRKLASAIVPELASSVAWARAVFRFATDLGEMHVRS